MVLPAHPTRTHLHPHPPAPLPSTHPPHTRPHSAYDAVDGDVTANLARSLPPGAASLDTRVPRGEADPWLLTYQVADSAGNRAVAFRRVVVLCPPGEGGGGGGKREAGGKGAGSREVGAGRGCKAGAAREAGAVVVESMFVPCGRAPQPRAPLPVCPCACSVTATPLHLLPPLCLWTSALPWLIQTHRLNVYLPPLNNHECTPPLYLPTPSLLN